MKIAGRKEEEEEVRSEALVADNGIASLSLSPRDRWEWRRDGETEERNKCNLRDLELELESECAFA